MGRSVFGRRKIDQGGESGIAALVVGKINHGFFEQPHGLGGRVPN